MDLTTLLPTLLALAWLLPLVAFAVVWIGFSLPQLAGRTVRYGAQRTAGLLATGAIGLSLVLSAVALVAWLVHHPVGDHHPADAGGVPATYAGEFYSLAQIGDLRLSIGYYIDALTIVMFALVTLISTCVHVYAMGYLHEELDDVTDQQAVTRDGNYLERPGRYHRFYQYLSLFSFSMLGVVLAGNLAMVFVFWELVGICSYFLIGFYFERPAASAAANKAFIVNRVGDFGMLIGLMALWTSLGTLHFGDTPPAAGEAAQAGMFTQLRGAASDHQIDPTAMAAPPDNGADAGYLLLLVGGLGIFSGCVGKSAQFPLHTWLPDAMEGPTPVSALVHSATMVAAGVYLVARCYPLLVPEALLVVAVVGTVTLALAATVALVAVDIKRVLAYSTISQLGYMMVALGLGGWVAGLFHLVTHAFFKSLLFLGAGSVIHAVKTNDMRQMGGLRHTMPWTAYTMLVGCLAIVGAGFPAWGWGLSGFFSKDAILEQSWSFAGANQSTLSQALLWVPMAGALLTACYIFRMWYLTFAGQPADTQRHAHAHESPRSMVWPLVLLAVMAVTAGWRVPFTELSLTSLLEQARPAGTHASASGRWLVDLTLPAEHLSHAPEVQQPAGWTAFWAMAVGVLLATMVYVWRWLRADEIRQSFRPVYWTLANAWGFDQAYDWAVLRPVLWLSRLTAGIDRRLIDPLVNGLARIGAGAARALDLVIDRRMIDGSIDSLARRTWNLGLSLRHLQTGSLRQYVMFIVVGTLGLFALASLYWKYAVAG